MKPYNTGNPIGSTAPEDLYDNAGNIDQWANGEQPFHPDRLGVPRRTLAGMQGAFEAFLANSGYVFAGEYAAGITLSAYNQIVRANGEFWRVSGSQTLPYTLTGSGAPEGSALVSVGDAALRADITGPNGASFIGWQAGPGAITRTLSARLLDVVISADYPSATAFNAAKAGKLSLDGTGRLRSAAFVAGEEELAGATLRDSFVVGRSLTGLTDCHGFADRTVMSGVTDAGTYGSFDCTVRLNGSNVQDHVYSFQDRVVYAGSGTLQRSAGFLARPVHSGSGVVLERYGLDIGGLSVTGGGTVSEQTGVRIRNMAAGAARVGLKIDQSVGFAVFADGGAPSHFKGDVSIGSSSSLGRPLLVAVDGAPSMYFSPTTGAGNFGVLGNSVLRLQSNEVTRLEILATDESSTVRPGTDNVQPLGDATRRWQQLYAGTTTISTSDAREKTEVRKLTANEIAAAKDLAREIGAFRFLASVAEKGDKAREHIGMTVQRAIEVMESHGLDPFAYSFICFDEWDAMPEERDEDTGTVTQTARDSGSRYSFRFEGLLAFIAAGFEARLSALEA